MKCLALHAFVNKLVFALNQLPEALMPDVLTCQSSFDKRKSTSCCLFMLNGGSKQAETQRWKYYFGDSRPPGKSGICQLLPLLLGSIQSWNNSVELMIVYFRIRIDVTFFLLQNAIDDCLQKIPKSNAFLLVPSTIQIMKTNVKKPWHITELKHFGETSLWTYKITVAEKHLSVTIKRWIRQT